jgi:hypothetical protein
MAAGEVETPKEEPSPHGRGQGEGGCHTSRAVEDERGAGRLRNGARRRALTRQNVISGGRGTDAGFRQTAPQDRRLGAGRPGGPHRRGRGGGVVRRRPGGGLAGRASGQHLDRPGDPDRRAARHRMGGADPDRRRGHPRRQCGLGQPARDVPGEAAGDRALRAQPRLRADPHTGNYLRRRQAAARDLRSRRRQLAFRARRRGAQEAHPVSPGRAHRRQGQRAHLSQCDDQGAEHADDGRRAARADAR